MDNKMSKKNIVFITTGWGSAHGGINSFNTDFCKALADVVSEDYQVVCAVEKATDKDIKDAGKVRLIPLDSELNTNCVRIINDIITGDGEQIVLWAGHDLISGHIANEAKDKYGNTSVAFQHMAPWLYQSEKCGDGNWAHDLDMKQRDIAERCDNIFSVGPLLYDHSLELTDQNTEKVNMLIPGLRIKKRSNSNPKKFSGITFGRLGEYDDALKQGSLAAKSFFMAAKSMFPENTSTNIQFTLVGLSKDDKEYKKEFAKLEKECKKRGGKHNIVLNGLSYLEDRRELEIRLISQNLCMMLSKHEGFGLGGWEAIGAGIPLIVGTNSGLYALIREKYPDIINNLFDVNVGRGDVDINDVVDAIKEIEKSGEHAFEMAEKLRDGLRHYTWEHAAKEFAKVCGVPLQTDGVRIRKKQADTGSSHKASDIDEKIEKEIKKIFNNNQNRRFRDALIEEILQIEEAEKGSDEVSMLTLHLLDCSSHYEVLCYLSKAVKVCFEEATDKEKREIFNCAKDVFGWLVISHVDQKWVEEHRKTLFTGDKAPGIELPVTTNVGAEVLTSRIKKGKAGFEKSADDKIVGAGSLIKKRITIQEFGWDEDDKLFSFKKMLWKLVFKTEFPPGKKFNKDSNSKLNGKIRFMFDVNTFYFPINIKDDDEELISFVKDGACCTNLKKDLPDFKLVIINVGDKESPLLMNDSGLEGELLGFFELEPK